MECGLALLLAAWTAGRIALLKLTGWQALSSYGTAHWAGQQEIRRAGLFTPAGVPLGEWRGRILREPKGGHVALFGPPRSGKSWGCVMPTLTTFAGSVVVSDLRGELALHQKCSLRMLFVCKIELFGLKKLSK